MYCTIVSLYISLLLRLTLQSGENLVESWQRMRLSVWRVWYSNSDWLPDLAATKCRLGRELRIILPRVDCNMAARHLELFQFSHIKNVPEFKFSHPSAMLLTDFIRLDWKNKSEINSLVYKMFEKREWEFILITNFRNEMKKKMWINTDVISLKISKCCLSLGLSQNCVEAR